MGALTGKVCQVRGIATKALVLVNEKTHETPLFAFKTTF